MSEAKEIMLLPPEMLEKIFKYLNIKDICQTQLICRKWKEIIVKGNLVKKASGNMFLCYMYIFNNLIDKNIWQFIFAVH